MTDVYSHYKKFLLAEGFNPDDTGVVEGGGGEWGGEAKRPFCIIKF